MPKKLHEGGPVWPSDKAEVEGRKSSEWGAKSYAERGMKPFPNIADVKAKKRKPRPESSVRQSESFDTG